MLLDQKRTKRIVQVVAVLTSIAFVGIGVLVIGIIFFGDASGGNNTGSLVKEARELVDKTPRDADAWSQLAAALSTDNKPAEAVDAAKQAVKLEPDDLSRVQQLVTFQTQAGRPEDAIAALQDYTRRKPDDSAGFLLLGRFAQDSGKTVLARLSYQRFLALDPENLSAEAVRATLRTIGGTTVTASP